MNSLKASTVIGLMAAGVFSQAALAQTGGSAAQSAGSAAQSAGSAAQGAASGAASQASGAASQAAGAATGSSMAVPAADKKFAMMVAENDLAELQISNMALQKSNNEQVKQLAQKLIDDHTKTTNSMKDIASKQGLTLPTQPDAKHQALATKLQNESGEKFDKDYLTANSTDHHKVVKAFEKEASDGKDPEIKGFASQYLPAIQEHTKMIDDDKGQMSGSK